MKIQKKTNGCDITVKRQDLATLLILADRWIAYLEGEKERLLAHYREVGDNVSEEEASRFCEVCDEIRYLDERLEKYREIFRK